MSSHINNRRFFVIHLAEKDRPSPDEIFEIQVLDAEGRAESIGYAGIDDVGLEISEESIPFEVIQAARKQLLGHGDYVNARGESISPF